VGTGNPFYAGMGQDWVGGMSDADFREYMPTAGRWISPDPAGMAAFDLANPKTLNRYAYVLNNPCSLTDPLGLDTCSINIAFAGASSLTGPQLSAAESQINAILGAASNWLAQGNSVNANFNFTGRSDFTVNLTNAQGTPIAYDTTGQYPLGLYPGRGSSANVYLNTIAVNFAGYGVNPFGSAFGQVVGSVATHGLGHYALGVPASHTTDFGIMSRPPATTFNPSGFTYFGPFPSPFQQFTPGQAQGLFSFCQKKHPAGTSGRGGGRNGGINLHPPGWGIASGGWSPIDWLLWGSNDINGNGDAGQQGSSTSTIVGWWPL
jgi:RHS repeat-associated protein